MMRVATIFLKRANSGNWGFENDENSGKSIFGHIGIRWNEKSGKWEFGKLVVWEMEYSDGNKVKKKIGKMEIRVIGSSRNGAFWKIKFREDLGIRYKIGFNLY